MNRAQMKQKFGRQKRPSGPSERWKITRETSKTAKLKAERLRREAEEAASRLRLQIRTDEIVLRGGTAGL
jgi:hypothetical protein